MKVWAAGITAGTVALLVGGALAVAATQNTTTLAPGLRIAGTDVSGMTLEQALAAVGSRAASPPRVTVTAGKNTWTLSAEKLGWHADAQTSVDAALKITQERGVLQKLQGEIDDDAPDLAQGGLAVHAVAVQQLVRGILGHVKRARCLL